VRSGRAILLLLLLFTACTRRQEEPLRLHAETRDDAGAAHTSTAREQTMNQPPPATPPPTWDDFFDRVKRHLMTPPPGSEIVLRRAIAGHPPSDPPAAWGALVQSRSGNFLPFRPEMTPPPSAPRVAFPMEEGVCDTIRWRAPRGPYTLDLAETRYLISVRLRGLRPDPSSSPLDIAREAAHLLFPDDIDFAFVQASAGNTRPAFGQRDRAKPRKSPDYAHWLDYIRWWVSDDAVGFVTLKRDGLAHPDFPRTSEKLDIHWFDTPL
jgi:hypothetical protein